MSFPIPATPLPPLEPSALGAAAGPLPPSGEAGSGASFSARLETPAVEPSSNAAAIEATRGASVFETPQAIHDLVQHAFERGADMKPNELIALQLRVHEMTFQLESVSKAIEHGMSGTKTLLQTQA